MNHTGLYGPSSVVLSETAEPQSSSLHTTAADFWSHSEFLGSTGLHSPLYAISSAPAHRLFSPVNLILPDPGQRRENSKNKQASKPNESCGPCRTQAGECDRFRRWAVVSSWRGPFTVRSGGFTAFAQNSFFHRISAECPLVGWRRPTSEFTADDLCFMLVKVIFTDSQPRLIRLHSQYAWTLTSLIHQPDGVWGESSGGKKKKYKNYTRSYSLQYQHTHFCSHRQRPGLMISVSSITLLLKT